MLFGLHFLGIIKIGFLNREIRMDTKTKNGSSFGAYILGLAFAFGWTPCIGPQLGAILTLAASEADVIKGTLLLFVYAVGLGVPFLLVAFFFPHLAGLIQLIKRHLDKVERVMGVLLWTVGLMMLTGQFSEFSYWLLNTFPTLGTFG
jgi:cytochrome c-type biogenesis protein